MGKSAHGRTVFSFHVLSCKTDISACNCITGNPNIDGTNLIVKKLGCDPVILNQNKSGFFHRIQNLCKPQVFDSGAESLYQVMEFDVLSRDLGW